MLCLRLPTDPILAGKSENFFVTVGAVRFLKIYAPTERPTLKACLGTQTQHIPMMFPMPAISLKQIGIL